MQTPSVEPLPIPELAPMQIEASGIEITLIPMAIAPIPLTFPPLPMTIAPVLPEPEAEAFCPITTWLTPTALAASPTATDVVWEMALIPTAVLESPGAVVLLPTARLRFPDACAKAPNFSEDVPTPAHEIVLDVETFDIFPETSDQAESPITVAPVNFTNRFTVPEPEPPTVTVPDAEPPAVFDLSLGIRFPT